MKHLFLFIFLLIFQNLYAQISIDFPQNRAVFQRDNNNNGVITISVSYTQTPDKVEARLTPIIAGQGEAKDWTSIQNSFQKGYVLGTISAKGGWYKLEVHSIRNGVVVGTAQIEKVGVGEVFVIAGQSNAQGIENHGGEIRGATDDRVNTVNYYNSSGSTNYPPIPIFVPLANNQNIGPYGTTPWLWGKLGDLLVKRLNVPVMFFNAAWGGSTIMNWQKSSMRPPATTSINGVSILGMPYLNLRLSLNYYCNFLGVRAILWCQGENDNAISTSENDYFNNFQFLINQSRQDYGKNISWVVAHTSYNVNFNTGAFNSYAPVINAQNSIINSVSSVFSGPNTDAIQTPRPDGVHLQDGGLDVAANAWNESLNSSFFANATPQFASAVIDMNIECQNNTNVKLSIPNGYQSYNWSNGVPGQSINISQGNVYSYIYGTTGNVYFTPTINISTLYPTAPNTTALTATTVCQGQTITLAATHSLLNNFRWNNGATTPQINLTTGGSYASQVVSDYGCFSPYSNFVNVTINPLPATPSITIQGDTLLCSGQSVTLTANTTNPVTPIWNTGSTNPVLQINQNGSYSVKAINNSTGCQSLGFSKPVSVLVTENPLAPTVAQTGPYTMAITTIPNENGTETFAWNKDDVVLNKTTRIIKTTQLGNYSALVFRTTKIGNRSLICQSPFSIGVSYTSLSEDNSGMVIYPNPSSGIVNLETHDDLQNVGVTIYNLKGQRVWSDTIDKTDVKKTFDLNNLEKGNYILELRAENYRKTKRLLLMNN